MPIRVCEMSGGSVEPAHGVDQGKAGSYGALGIVFVRLRIAEIDQRPVAQILRDKPIGLADDLVDAAVIGSDHLAQVFGSRRAESAVEPIRSQNITVS